MSRGLALALVPLALIAALIAAFLVWRPLDHLSAGAPPREAVAFERVRLDGEGIHAYIRAEGSQPVAIAQVQVDDAYWSFEMRPEGALGRFATARIDIPYPWVEGEAHVVKLLTSTGTVFEHEIAAATASPSGGQWLSLALVGLFVGPIPVLLGLAFHPALRRAGRGAMTFLLGLTIGLLGFLLIDTIEEGLEAAGKALEGVAAGGLFWGSAATALLVLLALSRRGDRPPEGLALAGYIALGIGLHNLGEGLAIGASLATGEVALASFLILGFAVHNVTEGIGIAAPIAELRPTLAAFAGLTLLAGAPAIAGTWAGAYAYAPHLAALCFGLGAGAILQVIVEIGLYLARRSPAGAVSLASVGGAVAGLAVMYGTSLLITA